MAREGVDVEEMSSVHDFLHVRQPVDGVPGCVMSDCDASVML